MKKILFVMLLIVVIIAIISYIYVTQYKQSSASSEQLQSIGEIKEKQPTIVTSEVKEFEITAKQFSFEPNIITVNKGDTVKLTITSADLTHGFAINEFNVNKKLEPEKTINAEFIADKTGTFSFYCSIVCGGGHSGMRGQLVVK